MKFDSFLQYSVSMSLCNKDSSLQYMDIKANGAYTITSLAYKLPYLCTYLQLV